jgi:hypothetical protein
MSGRGFTFARRHALAAGHAKPTAVMIGRWLSAEALRGPGELGMVELDVGLVLNALHGNVELAFGGLERVREIVIDLDIAEDPAFPAFLREYRAPLYAAWCAANPAANYGDRAYDSLRRRWERDAWTAFYGGRIQATIALLRRRMRAAGIPDGALEVVTSASRGVHLSLQLDEPVDVHAAAHVARRLALSLAVPEGVSVEAFPVATSGLGRMCGATLTGRQRACSDGLRGTGADRLTDLRRHNDRPRVTLELLDALARVEVANDASRNPGSGALVPVAERPIPRCAHRDPDWAQLRGHAFVTRVIEIVETTGIEAGCSWETIRKIAPAFRYAGHDFAGSLSGLRRLIEREGNTALSCQTDRGRRELLAVAVSQLRHFDRGLAAGRCRVGDLQQRGDSGRLRRLLGELVAGQSVPQGVPLRAAAA